MVAGGVGVCLWGGVSNYLCNKIACLLYVSHSGVEVISYSNRRVKVDRICLKCKNTRTSMAAKEIQLWKINSRQRVNHEHLPGTTGMDLWQTTWNGGDDLFSRGSTLARLYLEVDFTLSLEDHTLIPNICYQEAFPSGWPASNRTQCDTKFAKSFDFFLSFTQSESVEIKTICRHNVSSVDRSRASGIYGDVWHFNQRWQVSDVFWKMCCSHLEQENLLHNS